MEKCISVFIPTLFYDDYNIMIQYQFIVDHVLGKTKVLQLLKSKEVRLLADKFGDPNVSQHDIGKAGCGLFIRR